MYDNQYSNGQYHQMNAPPPHFDGAAFWYRPDTQDSLYEQESTLYAGGAGIHPSAMEATGIKHRRTRSGCFTCRSRRVKVRNSRDTSLYVGITHNQ
jgi:hypothetical protein